MTCTIYILAPGIPIREVKSSINRVVCRLNQDEELRKQYRAYNSYSSAVKPISIQDSACDIMKQQMLDDLLTAI